MFTGISPLLTTLPMTFLGGRQGKIPVVAFEVFDFAENKWRKLPDIPSKRVFALYTHSEKHIYSIGKLVTSTCICFTWFIQI